MEMKVTPQSVSNNVQAEWDQFEGSSNGNTQQGDQRVRVKFSHMILSKASNLLGELDLLLSEKLAISRLSLLWPRLSRTSSDIWSSIHLLVSWSTSFVLSYLQVILFLSIPTKVSGNARSSRSLRLALLIADLRYLPLSSGSPTFSQVLGMLNYWMIPVSWIKSFSCVDMIFSLTKSSVQHLSLLINSCSKRFTSFEP